MFCANCGSSFEGTPKFCPKCGAMLNANAQQMNPTAEQPAAPQLKNTFANAPKMPQPETEVNKTIPQQPEFVRPTPAPDSFKQQEQVNYAQTFQNPVAPVKAPKSKKKGFKNPKVWIVSAIIAVLVAVLAIFNAGKIGNFFVKLFTSDEGYTQHVHEKAAEDLSSDFSKLYSNLKNTFASFSGEGGGENTAAKGEIKLEVGEELISILSKASGTDLSWVKSASVGYEVNMKDGKYDVDLSLIFNGIDLVSAEVIVDMVDTKMMYITCEDLIDTYISMPLQIDAEAQQAMELLGQIADDLPEPEVVEKLINRYVSVALNAIEEVEKENDTVEVGDVKAKYEKYTVTVDGDLVADMIESVLEEAKDDDELKDIIESVLKAVAPYAFGSEDVDTSELIDEFEDALDEISGEIDGDMFGDFEFDYSFWVNGEGDIIGFEIEIEGGTISMVAPEKGKKSAFEFKIEPPQGEPIIFSGDAETKSGKKNGKYTLEVQGQEILTVSLIDYDVKLGEKGYFNGAIEIAPSDEIMGIVSSELVNGAIPKELANMIADGFKLRLDVATSEKEASYGVSILSGKNKLISLSSSSKLSEASSVKVPSDHINAEEVKSPDQLGLDPEKILTTLITKLKQAGVPDELLSQINKLPTEVNNRTEQVARPNYNF